MAPRQYKNRKWGQVWHLVHRLPALIQESHCQTLWGLVSGHSETSLPILKQSKVEEHSEGACLPEAGDTCELKARACF